MGPCPVVIYIYTAEFGSELAVEYNYFILQI